MSDELRRRLGLNGGGLPGVVRAGERRDPMPTAPIAGPPVYDSDRLGPWDGSVRVTAWETRTGRAFAVEASWTGPPLAGPGNDAPGPVNASDLVFVAEQEHAVRIARAAAAMLRRPERPNLLLLRDQH